MLEVRLFGAGRIVSAGREMKVGSRRWTLPLLTYLALHNGAPVLRKRVAFTLWPDEPEETALINLRRNLHRLRGVLPDPGTEPWIHSNAESLTWNASAPWTVDVLAYEKLREDPARLAEAAELYRGDLLEDFYDDWIVTERERLRALFHADLTALIVAHRSRRAFTTAAQYAERLLQDDPWREDTLRALMSVRYEAGDAAGALAEFDRFARLIHDEMRAVPMPETVALRDAIASGSPILPAAPHATPDAKHAFSDVPFVGREDQLARLRDHWARAAMGNGGAHFVRGEAGIGKSRLVSELALIAESEGGRVLLGATSRPPHTAYQSLSNALRSRLPLAASVSLAPQLLASIAELIPELRSFRSDVPDIARLDPERERARLIDALTQLLIALSRPRPLVVILEDLHRAESSTIEALREIVPRLAQAQVLIVATYRPEDTPRSHPLALLTRALETGANTTEVRPLQAAEIHALAIALRPQEAENSALIDALVRQSNGNALFAIELLREAVLSDAGYLAAPATLATMIAQRVESLTPAARRVAEIAAVAGEDFRIGIVQDIAGLALRGVLDQLDELLDRHIVREAVEGVHSEYQFSHHLVHAAVYDASPVDARTRRHHRMARILVETNDRNTDEHAAEIALHFERGDDPAQAARQYARAARHAAALYANSEACQLVSRALELGDWSTRECFDLFMLRSTLYGHLGDHAQHAADLDEAGALAERLGADAQCMVMERRVRLATRQANRDVEIACLERLTETAMQQGDTRWLAIADELHARLEERNGNLEGAVESALAGLHRFQTLGDDAASARLGGFAARVNALLPNGTERSDRLISDALAAAERTNDALVRSFVLYDAVVVAYEKHDHERGVVLGRAALDVSRQTGHRVNESNALKLLGVALWTQWRIPEALESLFAAARLTRELGLTSGFYATACDLGAVLCPVGDFEGCIEWSRHAMKAPGGSSAIVAAMNIAEAHYLRGDVEALAAIMKEAEPLTDRHAGSRFYSAYLQNAGRLLRCQGCYAESIATLEEAIALDERLGRWENAAQDLDDLALTYLADGRRDAAVDAVQRSTALVAGRERPDGPLHHWTEACVYRAAGELDRARSSLKSGNDLYRAKREALREAKLQAHFDAIPFHRAISRALERDEWPLERFGDAANLR